MLDRKSFELSRLGALDSVGYKVKITLNSVEAYRNELLNGGDINRIDGIAGKLNNRQTELECLKFNLQYVREMTYDDYCATCQKENS